MCRNTHLQEKGKGGNMKALIYKASDYKYKEIKEINNINDLKNIYNNIIIDFTFEEETQTDMTITIYDDYVE